MARLSSIRTSHSHPIRVDAVQPDRDWGLIGMSFCPGKKQQDGMTGQWDRDLVMDLKRIKAWGAVSFVSILELHELTRLEVPNLPDEVERMGMAWRHLPVEDRNAPGQDFEDAWPVVGNALIDLLLSGQKIFLHCMGGLGRTGTVAACLLIESGVAPNDAINRVRAARPGTIETDVQERFVRAYRARFSGTAER